MAERPVPSVPPAPADPADRMTTAAPSPSPSPSARPPASLLDHPLRWRTALPMLLLLIALPPVALLLREEFYIGLATRVLVFALAATSLNLVLGFGGMVSFGHAAFVGLGAYAVGILMQQGVTSAWIAWPAAMAASALFLLLEEVLSAHTLHWQFALGAVLLAVVLAAPRGLAGWRRGRSA